MALSPFFTHQVIHERTDGPASGLLERLDPGQAPDQGMFDLGGVTGIADLLGDVEDDVELLDGLRA